VESIIPSTSERVPLRTSDKTNRKIASETIKRLDEIGYDKFLIEERLDEIEREWDIERILETHASSLVLIGLALGATVDKKWFLLSGAAAGFFLLHAIQGWYPPLEILRRWGVRTQREIDEERTVLKLRRGDHFTKKHNSREALNIVHKR
jgi:hypothetical protein